jgi:alanyl-tRNA synthetase
MTERIYYQDPYALSFDAEVVALAEAKGATWELRLDRSAFYPTGGGQLHDVGEVGGVAVQDVYDADGEVVHVLADSPRFAVGDSVRGRVDADRRRHHRQQHSGQHILSRALELQLGLATESARLGESSNSIDLEVEDIDSDALARVEREANRIIWAGRPVHIRLMQAEEADSAELRKKANREGVVRVIEIEEFDRCPCGGTHVANSAEIGLLTITKMESIARGMRLHFLCGERAFEYLRGRDAMLAEMALRFTSGADQLLEKFERMDEESRRLKKELADSRAEIARRTADEWLSAAEAIELAGGRAARFFQRRLEGDQASQLSQIAARLRRTPDLICALYTSSEASGQLLLGRGEALDLDCGAELRLILDAVGGRGGGRPEQAQGSFPAAALEDVERALAERYRDRS